MGYTKNIEAEEKWFKKRRARKKKEEIIRLYE